MKDVNEPLRVADAVKKLGLKYAVITSVTRDDLETGGADIFALTIENIRNNTSDCKIEVLIPDFQGNFNALIIVLNAKPDILNHNIETVPSLYNTVRPQANYERSLQVLRFSNKKGFTTKSGLMVGLGESIEEIIQVMHDLKNAGCDILTIGQYLQPSKINLPVKKYYTNDEFAYLKAEGLKIGIKSVIAGPLVRSSYNAEEIGKLFI